MVLKKGAKLSVTLNCVLIFNVHNKTGSILYTCFNGWLYDLFFFLVLCFSTGLSHSALYSIFFRTFISASYANEILGGPFGFIVEILFCLILYFTLCDFPAVSWVTRHKLTMEFLKHILMIGIIVS